MWGEGRVMVGEGGVTVGGEWGYGVVMRRD